MLMALTPALEDEIRGLLQKGEEGGMLRHMSSLMELLKTLGRSFFWRNMSFEGKSMDSDMQIGS